MRDRVKGTVSRDFRILVFSKISFPKAPEYTVWAVSNFSKKFSEIFAAQGAPPVIVETGEKWKKSSIIKVLTILFGHLWDVELTHRYIFAFQFTLKSQQPDIVPIICHRYQQH
jgi:hypothetical protein